MVGSLTACRDKTGCSAEVTNHGSSLTNRSRVAFNSEGYIYERWPPPCDKCHEGMDRSDGDSLLAERLQFIGSQSSTAVKRISHFALAVIRDEFGHFMNLAIRNANPEKVAI